MKIPNEIKLYCEKCGKHTVHKLKEFKIKNPRTLSRGQRKAERKRKGYGANKIKAHKKTERVKQSEKPTFIATCKECGRKTYFVVGKRMRKVELVSVVGK